MRNTTAKRKDRLCIDVCGDGRVRQTVVWAPVRRLVTAPPRTFMVAATCAVGLGLVMFDNTATILALPAIGRSFDADTPALQWVAAVMFLAAATCLPLSGTVGDRFGARRAMRIGLAVFGLSAVVAALAPSVEVLVCARIGQGLGVALCLPNGAALLAANIPAGPARNRAIGTWITVSSAGLVLG